MKQGTSLDPRRVINFKQISSILREKGLTLVKTMINVEKTG